MERLDGVGDLQRRHGRKCNLERYLAGYWVLQDHGAEGSGAGEQVSGGGCSSHKMCTWRFTLYPLPEITVAVDGLLFQVEATVSEKLPAAVLLGTDVPELSTLLGVDKLQEVEPQDVMVVVTHAQARRQLEEEILRRETEIQSGAKSTKIAELEDQPEGASALEQKRELRKQMHTSRVPENGATPTLDFSAGELQKMQQADPSLEKIREAAWDVPNSSGGGFFERNGLLYRRWVPPGREEEQGVEQLVLPN